MNDVDAKFDNFIRLKISFSQIKISEKEIEKLADEFMIKLIDREEKNTKCHTYDRLGSSPSELQ